MEPARMSTALVWGTANSVQSTEGTLFKVSIEPDIVAWFSYDYGHSGVALKPGVLNRTVTMGLPAGLPLYGNLPGYRVIE